MSENIIEIDGISKHFGNTVAVAQLSLQIRAGEFFSLLGPSGCGKTTLLRMIAGFESPSTGRIFVHGQDVTAVAPYKRPVNMVFQNYALFPHLTVFENVAFGLRCRKVRAYDVLKDEVEGALALVGLQKLKERYPSQISGGQQQRVALARAVVNRPKVLLLDEPLSALDLKIRQEMQDELSRLQHELKMTFIMVTHDQGESLALSNRIAVFHQGQLEQLGTPEEVYEKPASPFVADFIGHSNLMPGIISQKAQGKVEVEISTGIKLWVTDNPGLRSSAGDAVLVFVRRQSIKIVDPGMDTSNQENQFRAVVVSRSYQGEATDYIASISGSPASRFKLCCPDGQAASFAVGQEVVICIPSSKASVLPATAGSADPAVDVHPPECPAIQTVS